MQAFFSHHTTLQEIKMKCEMTTFRKCYLTLKLIFYFS